MTMQILSILGDLWSYNADEDAFIVSPEPDTYCYTIDISQNRCLILGTDGCWNMLNAQQVLFKIVFKKEELLFIFKCSCCIQSLKYFFLINLGTKIFKFQLEVQRFRKVMLKKPTL